MSQNQINIVIVIKMRESYIITRSDKKFYHESANELVREIQANGQIERKAYEKVAVAITKFERTTSIGALWETVSRKLKSNGLSGPVDITISNKGHNLSSFLSFSNLNGCSILSDGDDCSDNGHETAAQ